MIYYMRDNETMCELSDNPTVAMQEIEREFNLGWTYGRLCSSDGEIKPVLAAGSSARVSFFEKCKQVLEAREPLTKLVRVSEELDLYDHPDRPDYAGVRMWVGNEQVQQVFSKETIDQSLFDVLWHASKICIGELNYGKEPAGSYNLWDNTKNNPLAPKYSQNYLAWQDGYNSAMVRKQWYTLNENEAFDEAARDSTVRDMDDFIAGAQWAEKVLKERNK